VLENKQENLLVHRKRAALLLPLCRSTTYRRTNKDNPDRKKDRWKCTRNSGICAKLLQIKAKADLRINNVRVYEQ
jgi:hypothetical protein